MSTQRAKVPERETDFTHDGAIAALWKLGVDSYDIGKQLHLPEWQVVRRLAQLREERLKA